MGAAAMPRKVRFKLLTLVTLIVACDASFTLSPAERSPLVARVVLSPDTASLHALGDTIEVTATAYDADGQPVDTATLAWASLQPEIASVDGMGHIIANLAGTALITATAVCCDVIDTMRVDIDQVVASVVIDPSSAYLQPGQTLNLAAEARDSNNVLIDEITSFIWTSSDTVVASVDQNGTVMSKELGQATISAEADGVTGASIMEVTESGGSPNFPNEPAGFTRWAEHDFSCIPGTNGCTELSHAGYATEDLGSKYAQVADASDPTGDGQVVRITYPEGMDDGVTPGRFFVWDNDQGDEGSTRLDAWYVSLWIKLEGPSGNEGTWELPPDIVKLWYNGIGDPRAGANKGGPVNLKAYQGAYEIVSHLGLSHMWRECPSCIIERHDENSPVFSVNKWHHLEFYGEASEVNVRNATYRLWLDGELILEDTDVMNQSDDQGSWTDGFYQFHWAPVFGGYDSDPGTVKSRDDYMRLAHLYISGKPR